MEVCIVRIILEKLAYYLYLERKLSKSCVSYRFSDRIGRLIH